MLLVIIIKDSVMSRVYFSACPKCGDKEHSTHRLNKDIEFRLFFCLANHIKKVLGRSSSQRRGSLCGMKFPRIKRNFPRGRAGRAFVTPVNLCDDATCETTVDTYSAFSLM